MANPAGNVANLVSLPSGSAHPKWTSERMIASTGYAKLRVGRGHPLADPNGYAYEHLVIWIAAGKPRPGPGEVLHHVSGDKLDNRLENLTVHSRRQHAAEHHPMVADLVVREIRERYAAGEDGTALAELYKLPPSRVYRFIKGKSRKSAGGPICTGNLRNRKSAGVLADEETHGQAPNVEGEHP